MSKKATFTFLAGFVGYLGNPARALIRTIFCAILVEVFSMPANAACTGSLPKTLTNGQTANADDVMANLNYLLNNCGGGGGGTSQWTTNGNSLYFNTGNVGIGATSPGHRLIVVGSTVGDGIWVSSNGSSTGVTLADGTTERGDFGYVKIAGQYATGATVGDIVVAATDGGSTAKLHLATGSGPTARLTVDGSGNVGIGTTSPANTLSVVGATGTNIFSVSDGSRAGGFYINGNAVWMGGFTSSVPTVFNANNNGNMAAYPSSGTYFGLYPWTDPGANNVAIAGKLGVGTASPSYTLHVNGTAYATGAAGALSDVRDKKDIAPLSITALDAIAKLRPVAFFWKSPKDDGMKGRQTGLIAQEVEKVLPSTILTAKDVRKSKAIKYDELTAVLIKAVQEQQAEIRKLQSANDKLEARLASIERNRLTKR